MIIKYYFCSNKNRINLKSDYKIVSSLFKNYILPSKFNKKETNSLIYKSYFYLSSQKLCFLLMPICLKSGINDIMITNKTILNPLLFFSLYSFLSLFQTYLDNKRILFNNNIVQKAWLDISLKAYYNLLEQCPIQSSLKNNNKQINEVYSFEKGKKAIENNLILLTNSFIPIFLDKIISSSLLFYFCGYKYFVISLLCYFLYFKVTFDTMNVRSPYIRMINKLDNKANFITNDAIRNNLIVKNFGLMDLEFYKYKSILNKTYEHSIVNKMMLTKINFNQKFITSSAMFISLTLALFDLKNGNISPGDIVLIQSTLMQSFMPLFNLGNLLKFFEDSVLELRNLIKIVDKDNENDKETNLKNINITKGDIQFDNITLKYHNKTVLKNFTLDINSGDVILITGRSGIGKSSIFNILLKYLNPVEGKILIDSQDINEFKTKSVRDNISICYQQNLFFNDTILNNLKYGNIAKYDNELKQNIDNDNAEDNNIDDNIISLCKEFNLYNTITELDKGFNYVFGDNANKISGGEKQRLNIIRCLLKDSQIMLFDEPTTGLDAFNYKIFTEKIKSFKNKNNNNKKTVIIISHDLDLAEICDKVLCIENSHSYQYDREDKLLLDKDSLYYKLKKTYLENKNNKYIINN